MNGYTKLPGRPSQPPLITAYTLNTNDLELVHQIAELTGKDPTQVVTAALHALHEREKAIKALPTGTPRATASC